MWRFHLAIDKGELVLLEMLDECGQGDFRRIPYSAKHGFAKKYFTDTDAI